MAKTYSRPCELTLPLIYDASKELLAEPLLYYDGNDKPFSEQVDFIRKNKIIGKNRNSDHISKNNRVLSPRKYISEHHSPISRKNCNCCHHVTTKNLSPIGQELNYYEKNLAQKIQQSRNLAVENNDNDIVRLYQGKLIIYIKKNLTM